MAKGTIVSITKYPKTEQGTTQIRGKVKLDKTGEVIPFKANRASITRYKRGTRISGQRSTNRKTLVYVRVLD
tara:strand:- start:110 stop:325 length:216 start_codon:yes stop_codon:yes gene_type:complete